MAENRAQGGSGGDDGKLIAAFIVTTVTVIVSWYVFRKPIVYFKYGLDWIQLQAIALFRMVTGSELGPRGKELRDYVSGIFTGVWDPNEVQFADLVKLSNEVGLQLRVVFFLLIIAIAAYVAKNMKGGGYSRTFSLVGVPMNKRKKIGFVRQVLPGFLGGAKAPSAGSSFMGYQAEHWRVVQPSVDWDPDAKDAPASSMAPLVWMRAHGVPLKKETGFDDASRAAAEKAFVQQLGDNWNGFAKAPLYAQAVLTVCILQARTSSLNGSVQLLKEELACAYVTDSFKDGSAVRAVMKPYLEDEKIAAEVNKRSTGHAYVNTVLYQNLSRAKIKGGVFAPAEILWLRKVDRHAWYTADTEGRKAHFAESAGMVAHWMAERACRCPLSEPYVTPAVDALEKYLTEHAIIDLEEWYENQTKDD